MMRRTGILMVCCVAIASCGLTHPTTARAGEARSHDGFFMRLSTGAGAARSKLEDTGGEVTLKGTAGDVNLAFGAIVSPNLALHGTIWGWSVSDPDADITINGFGSGSGSFNGTLTMAAIGPGATYYFMPTNIYVSGPVGMATLTGDKEVDGKTDPGFAMDLTLGKEWWVGDAWALGLAGDFAYFSAKNKDFVTSDKNWAGPSFGLRFSATFN